MQNTLFIQSESQKPGYQICKSTGRQAKNIQKQALNQLPGIRILKLQTGARQNQNQGVSCTISQQTGLQKSAQNKDQRSDSQTDVPTGVFIQWEIKHTKRIMGCEEGLNNYQRDATQGYIRQSEYKGKTQNGITHISYTNSQL